MERDVLAFACSICDSLIELDALDDDICETCERVLALDFAISLRFELDIIDRWIAGTSE